MATEAAWLNGNRFTERRKQKCALTSTGLLMEGLMRKYVRLISADRSLDERWAWRPPHHLDSASYSYRKETMGSTREARLAGK
jgi:hypothetical protein